MRRYGHNTDPDWQQAHGRNVYCDECGILLWHGRTRQWMPHHSPWAMETEAGPDCGASHWFCDDCLDAIETKQAVWEARLIRRGATSPVPHLVLWSLVP